MDLELQQRIQAARDAGYSDEEIQASLGGNVTVVPSKVESIPSVPVLSAEERARLQQEETLETERREDVASAEKTTSAATAIGLGVGSALGTGALLYGAKKVLGGGSAGKNLVQRSVSAAEEANKIAAKSAQQLHEREMARLAARSASQTAQVARPVAPGPILDQYGRPYTPPPQPIAPQPMPQATAQPDSLTNRVRTAAASKIQNLPGAGMMGSAGRMVGRVLPGAGTVLNAADAYSRAQQGDYLGAGIAGIGAAASPFPILGTAVGMGTGALNAYRDYLKQEEEKKRMQQ